MLEGPEGLEKEMHGLRVSGGLVYVTGHKKSLVSRKRVGHSIRVVGFPLNQ